MRLKFLLRVQLYSFVGADIQHLLRENRELRREVALGESRLAHTWGGAGYASPTRSRMAPWHPMLTPDDDVIEELVGNVNSAHGSVGQWLNTCATPLECVLSQTPSPLREKSSCWCAGSAILLSLFKPLKILKGDAAWRRSSKCFRLYAQSQSLSSHRRSSDPNGTIKLALGPSIKAELKFIV